MRRRRMTWWSALIRWAVMTGCLGFPILIGSGGLALASRTYDVAVVGADPEGVAAAVAAARVGARTLLVDTRDEPGGLFTHGWLNSLDLNPRPGGGQLNRGLFLEFFRQVEGDSFTVETAARVFRRMIAAEANLTWRPGMAAVLPRLAGCPRVLINPGQSACRAWLAPVFRNPNRFPVPIPLPPGQPPVLDGLVLLRAGGPPEVVTARFVIDATQDADIAAAVGVPFTVGQEDCAGVPVMQAVTAVLRLDGIGPDGWRRLGDAAKARREGNRSDWSVWGFGRTMKGYRPSNPRVGVRGPNFGRQRDGSVLMNALHVYDIDGTSGADRATARRLAAAEVAPLVDFLRARLPGFENATCTALAPELYVRETRHLVGLYRLTVDDVLENRDHPDRIGFGSYPLDVQATSATFAGDVIGRPRQYSVPLRCLLPEKVRGLMVVGRAASYDSLPHASTRTVPVGMAAGQAAGVAAALAVRRGAAPDPRDLADDAAFVAAVQRALVAQGVELTPAVVPTASETLHWAYRGLRAVRARGLASGGYQNDYRLDEPMSGIQLVNRLCRMTGPVPDGVRAALFRAAGRHPRLTVETACSFLWQRATAALELPPGGAARGWAETKRLIDPEVARRFPEGGSITVGAGYLLLADFTRYWHATEAGESAAAR